MTWRWRLRDVHDVEVDDADGAHTRGCEVEHRRGAQPAGADEQHLRAQQLRLALGADLRHEEMPRVALLLLPRQDDRVRPRAAARLPALEAAAHRARRPRSPWTEGLGGEQRPGAARAVEDQGRVVVGSGRLDLLLEVAAGHVGGAHDVALVPFVRSRTSMSRAPRPASSSASAGPTSGTSARASRNRSDRVLVMIGRAPVGRRPSVRPSGKGWAGQGGAGQAGRVHHRVALMRMPPGRRRLPLRLLLRERALERVQ